MGNILSVIWSGRALPIVRVGTMERPNESENEDLQRQEVVSVGDNEARVKAKEQEMEEFKKELSAKREQRKEILNRHRNEKKELEASVDDERKAKLEAYETNRQLRELLTKNNIEIPETLLSCKEDTDISDTITNMKGEFEKLRDNNIKLRRSLAETTGALQSAYSDMADLQAEHTASIKQIGALKEVVKMSKTLINLREGQLTELKNKLTEIEQSLADREASMLSTDLRNEYVRQLQNIRTLRSLYEERARLAEATKQSVIRELDEQKALYEAASNKRKELEAKVEELEAKVNELLETLDNKNSQISASQAETHGLKNEMSVVNKLFSQVLLGYKSKQDLDKLVHRLEENHGLLTHMAEKEKDNGSEASTALPKLLLELVSQVDEGEEVKRNVEALESTGESVEEETGPESSKTSAEEIVENLPKVWKVLIELLSHQSMPEESTSEKVTTCYKSVETKSGPVLVPSVSQTYIRLKDLIVEKLALVKEVNRMKQLNVHLESRLGEQERRLCLVTTELSKTWHVVGRLRRHHHQLHTHEKILKYELQQKRKLLNELKEELEYCREKWEQAREKNTQSEKDWKKLRAEFTSRKKIDTSFNLSAESGYSDERPSDESSESNDESEYVTNPLVRSKKKLKKSFENMLDSSADCNLVAEREDPVSDLLDVAELPLDNQDGDSHDISDSYNSESIFKSEIICEETEDEIADIAHDSCVEDVGECSQEGNAASSSAHTLRTQDTTVQMTIDPAEILKSIKHQNERLAKKDEKLENLEKSSAVLLKQTQMTVKISKQISDALDNVINRPSSSNQRFDSPNLTTNSKLEKLENDSSGLKQTLSTIEVSNKINDTLEVLPNYHTSSNIDKDNSTNKLEKLEITVQEEPPDIGNKTLQEPIRTDEDTKEVGTDASNSRANEITRIIPKNSVTCVDFKAIMENVKKQNDKLTKKDKRFQKLETGCTEVIAGLTKTLNTAANMSQKLEAIHENHQTDSDYQSHTSTEGASATISGAISYNDDKLSQTDLNDRDNVNSDAQSVKDDPETVQQNFIPNVDLKIKLENVKKQTKMLSKKDERLQSDPTEVKDGLNKTLGTTNDISEKLEAIHEVNQANLKKNTLPNSKDGNSSTTSDLTTIINQEISQPSKSESNEIANDVEIGTHDPVLAKEKSDKNTIIRDFVNKPETSPLNETLYTLTNELSVSSENISDSIVEDPSIQTDNSEIDNSDETTVIKDTDDARDVDETPGTSNEAGIPYECDDYIDREPHSRESSEPSNSSELDHEARFAARDIRLKRLEEQTKSLVKKVNKTTSKGVKIHYKLEELHNIYGSADSRAGTPSEDDRSQNDGDEE